MRETVGRCHTQNYIHSSTEHCFSSSKLVLCCSIVDQRKIIGFVLDVTSPTKLFAYLISNALISNHTNMDQQRNYYLMIFLTQIRHSLFPSSNAINNLLSLSICSWLRYITLVIFPSQNKRFTSQLFSLSLEISVYYCNYFFVAILECQIVF